MAVAVIVGVLLLPSLLLFFRWIRTSKTRMLIDKIPGPPDLPLIGNAHQLESDSVAFYQQLLGFCKTYGESSGVYRLWSGSRPCVCITKPEIAKVLLTSSENITKSFMYDFLLPWLGTGLLTRTTEIFMDRTKTPWMWPNFIFNLTPSGREHNRCLKTLHDFTNKVIRDRRVELENKDRHTRGSNCCDDDKRTDDERIGKKRKQMALLDLLLQYSTDADETMTDQDIREEVDTIMFAGHDTSASAISWAIYLLGTNPEIQKKLQQELDDLFGESNRTVTLDDLNELKYLECIIKESLRLFPSVPIYGRQLSEDILIGEYLVPKGTTAYIMASYIHMDKRHFPDPDRFDPDRWQPENSIDRHPFCYIPFSAGLRNCIGQKFAMMEGKVLLSQIFRRFTITSMQKREDLRLSGDVVLRPEKEILIKLTNRL